LPQIGDPSSLILEDEVAHHHRAPARSLVIFENALSSSVELRTSTT
jgi:hypothetical protein